MHKSLAGAAHTHLHVFAQRFNTSFSKDTMWPHEALGNAVHAFCLALSQYAAYKQPSLDVLPATRSITSKNGNTVSEHRSSMNHTHLQNLIT